MLVTHEPALKFSDVFPYTLSTLKLVCELEKIRKKNLQINARNIAVPRNTVSVMESNSKHTNLAPSFAYVFLVSSLYTFRLF